MSLPDGEPLASFPEMSTSFGARARCCAAGSSRRSWSSNARSLHLARDPSGAITARIASPDEQPAPISGRRCSSNWPAPRQRDAPLGLLQRLRIRGATVIVDDRRSRPDLAGRTGSMSRSSAAARASEAIFRWPCRSAPACRSCTRNYRYFADRHVLDLDLSIDGVEPTAIPPLIPELAQLQHLQAAGFRHAADPDRSRPRQRPGLAARSRLGKGRLRQRVAADRQRRRRKRRAARDLRAGNRPRSGSKALTLDLGGGTELVARRQPRRRHARTDRRGPRRAPAGHSSRASLNAHAEACAGGPARRALAARLQPRRPALDARQCP